MLRRLLPATRMVSLSSARSYSAGDKFSERERSAEQMAVRKHEKELLERHAENRRTSSSAAASAAAAAAGADDSVRGTVTFTGEEVLTVEEFLQFRRVFTQRLARLEAEVAKLSAGK